MKILFISLILVFLFCPAARCDTIYLQDGTKIEGEIVNIDGDRVDIKTAEDTFTMSRERIKKVVKDKEEDKKIDEERRPVGPGVPQWDLKWD